MKFTRKGFFQSIFGGVIAAIAAPPLLKAEEKPLTVKTNGNIGLGISNPDYPLVVSGLIFQVGERQIQMAGNENGDFQIKWLDVEEKEVAPILTIHQPTIETFKTQFRNDIR